MGEWWRRLSYCSQPPGGDKGPLICVTVSLFNGLGAQSGWHLNLNHHGGCFFLFCFLTLLSLVSLFLHWLFNHISKLCSVTVWFWCELPLPPFLPEANMVRQRNSRVEPWGVCLQERQGKTEAFNRKQNTKDTFHTCLCVHDLTAVDGLRDLLQNSEQCDGGQPKAICALHPKTKTHTGIF